MISKAVLNNELIATKAVTGSFKPSGLFPPALQK